MLYFNQIGWILNNGKTIELIKKGMKVMFKITYDT